MTQDIRDMYQIRKIAEHVLKTINFYSEGGRRRFGEMYFIMLVLVVERNKNKSHTHKTVLNSPHSNKMKHFQLGALGMYIKCY